MHVSFIFTPFSLIAIIWSQQCFDESVHSNLSLESVYENRTFYLSYGLPVVQTMDSATRRRNRYPVDKSLRNQLRYPMDCDLSSG